MKKLSFLLALVCLSLLFLNCEKASGVTGSPNSNLSSFAEISSSSYLTQSSSSSLDISSSASDRAGTIEIAQYFDDNGQPDGTWGVEVILPPETEENSVAFEITQGTGEWEFSQEDLYDGLNIDGEMGFSNYFFPSCSGDFEVTVSFEVDGISNFLVVSETISVDGLGACPESL